MQDNHTARVIARALAADHYAERFGLPVDDPHVAMNADGNWQLFERQAAVALSSIPSAIAMREAAAKVAADLSTELAIKRDTMLAGKGRTPRRRLGALSEGISQLYRAENAILGLPAPSPSAPIPMLLFCPKCGLQHVDEPDERTPDWDNPPHRSHLCHGCGCIWRPADVPTEGVRSIATAGKADTWAPAEAALPAPSLETARDALTKAAEAAGASDEYMSVTLSRDGVVTSHNAFDADFDDMVLATEKIISELQKRLSNRKFCPYSHGSHMKHGRTPAEAALNTLSGAPNGDDPCDPDLGKIGPGHVCKHGVRWPHPCQPCDDAALRARSKG